MSPVHFFFYLLLIDNLLFSYGLGLDFVLYRENRGFASFRIGGQGALFLLLGGSIFWAASNWILQPLGLVFLREFLGLLLSLGLASIQSLLDHHPSGKHLGCRTQYSNLYGSPTAFGFLMLLTVQGWTYTQVVVGAFAGGIGIGLISGIMYHLRLRMKLEKIPKILQGDALLFFALGLVSLSFSFFERLSFFFLNS